MGSDKHSAGDPPVEKSDDAVLAVEPGRPFTPKGEKRSTTDPESEQPLPPVPAEPLPIGIVQEDQVRGFLFAQGALAHSMIAVEKGVSSEWVYLEQDLEAIAPPLTRIINRFPVVAYVFERLGDYPAIGMGFAGYVGRSLEERAAGKAREALSVDVEPTSDAAFQFGPPAEGE